MPQGSSTKLPVLLALLLCAHACGGNDHKPKPPPAPGGSGGDEPGAGGSGSGGTGGRGGTGGAGGGAGGSGGATIDASQPTPDASPAADALPAERGPAGAPGFPGWKYQRPIRLDTTSAGANVMGEVTSYPVAVVLDAMKLDFSQARDQGEDIRFGAADGTPLPYAIELWSKTAQVAAIWVRVPRVAGNNAEQSINMYWGNATAGDAGDSKAVFPAADGYLGVWHLGEDGSAMPGAYPDASGAGNAATGVNLAAGAATDGRVGKGTKTVNAMEQWLRVDDDAAKFRPANMTSSIWGRAASFPGRSGPGGYDTIFSSGEFWTMQKFSLNRVFETCFANNCAVGKTMIATNAWRHFTVVRQGTNQRFYVDGAQDAMGSVSTRADAKPLGIGNQTQYLTNAGEKRSWDGVLDEARVLNVAKDVNWIKLEFESQKEGSTFLKLGAVQMR